MRKLETIAEEIRAVEAQIKELMDRKRDLQSERDDVKIAATEAELGSLLGRRVEMIEQRKTKDFMGRVTKITPTRQQGTVIVRRSEHGTVNGVAYIQTSTPIVISDTGKKGWPLTEAWHVIEEEK